MPAEEAVSLRRPVDSAANRKRMVSSLAKKRPFHPRSSLVLDRSKGSRGVGGESADSRNVDVGFLTSNTSSHWLKAFIGSTTLRILEIVLCN